MNNQASESRKEKNEHDEEITHLKAELEKERELRKELAWNEAIDEVITMLNEDVQHGYFEMYWNILKENLEKLKHKQP